MLTQRHLRGVSILTTCLLGRVCGMALACAVSILSAAAPSSGAKFRSGVPGRSASLPLHKKHATRPSAPVPRRQAIAKHPPDRAVEKLNGVSSPFSEGVGNLVLLDDAELGSGFGAATTQSDGDDEIGFAPGASASTFDPRQVRTRTSFAAEARNGVPRPGDVNGVSIRPNHRDNSFQFVVVLRTQPFTLSQSGTKNQATHSQEGNGQVATLTQSGNDNEARLLQSGSGNTIAAEQLGSGHSLVVIESGANGAVKVQQSGMAQVATLQQSGANNTISGAQAGHDGQVLINQSGNSNISVYHQAGGSNTLSIRQ